MFQALLEAGRDRQIILKIAQNLPSRLSPNVDTQILARKANAVVIFLTYILMRWMCHSRNKNNYTINFLISHNQS